MSNKMHLADAAEPLREGSTIVAFCSTPVERARFVVMWDEAEPLLNLSDLYDAISMMCCSKCLFIATQRDERYLYGIRSGEVEQKNSEPEVEEGSTCQTS